MPEHEATFIRLQNELADNVEKLFVFVIHPQVESTNKISERHVRREAEIRKGGRTRKTANGAERRGIIVSVLMSVRQRFANFTLNDLLDEVQKRIKAGPSIFEEELDRMKQANAPPVSPDLHQHQILLSYADGSARALWQNRHLRKYIHYQSRTSAVY